MAEHGLSYMDRAIAVSVCIRSKAAWQQWFPDDIYAIAGMSCWHVFCTNVRTSIALHPAANFLHTCSASLDTGQTQNWDM